MTPTLAGFIAAATIIGIVVTVLAVIMAICFVMGASEAAKQILTAILATAVIIIVGIAFYNAWLGLYQQILGAQ